MPPSSAGIVVAQRIMLHKELELDGIAGNQALGDVTTTKVPMPHCGCGKTTSPGRLYLPRLTEKSGDSSDVGSTRPSGSIS